MVLLLLCNILLVQYNTFMARITDCFQAIQLSQIRRRKVVNTEKTSTLRLVPFGSISPNCLQVCCHHFNCKFNVEKEYFPVFDGKCRIIDSCVELVHCMIIWVGFLLNFQCAHMLRILCLDLNGGGGGGSSQVDSLTKHRLYPAV